jgi:hypothetical protein
MKTYSLFYALLAVFAIGCSKSGGPIDDGGKNEPGVEAAYTVVVKDNGQLTATLLNADAETLSINDAESGFADTAEPELLFEEGKVLAMYHKKSDCSGKITVHDFNAATSKSFDVFTDLGTCNLTAKAIVKGGNTVYVAYELEQNTKTNGYFVRAVDISGAEATFVDVELEFKPVGLAFAQNRLFVLGLDEDITGDHKLTVLNTGANTAAYTENLGLDARGIFKNPDGNIVVSYDDRHTTFNSATLDFNYTNYPPDTAPNFIGSEFRHFDSSGKMYYAMLAGTHSIYKRIPAVYDFEKNSTVLYAYENFLTEAQRNFKFEIENTTVVQYDEANNLLLFGYEKSGGNSKGGLLRIKPIPEPEFVGNLDLDGIPYTIYID